MLSQVIGIAVLAEDRTLEFRRFFQEKQQLANFSMKWPETIQRTPQESPNLEFDGGLTHKAVRM
jgi:hypothetical protein